MGDEGCSVCVCGDGVLMRWELGFGGVLGSYVVVGVRVGGGESYGFWVWCCKSGGGYGEM